MMGRGNPCPVAAPVIELTKMDRGDVFASLARFLRLTARSDDAAYRLRSLIEFGNALQSLDKSMVTGPFV
jgi:hypothetical protein